MKILENLQEINLSIAVKEHSFTHVTFISEEILHNKLRLLFMLKDDNTPISIDLTAKDEKTIQCMTGLHSDTLIMPFEQIGEKTEEKIEEILKWLYTEISVHPFFRLRLVTKQIRFKFVKVSGNIVYHHRLSFLEKKNQRE